VDCGGRLESACKGAGVDGLRGFDDEFEVIAAAFGMEGEERLRKGRQRREQ
jgi:hypothetical protein